ncbi:hypothetical protein TL16_g06887 [Triparma laevis f. inornata]|uniref:Uncharacterized protein n=1 Tax=Triparma laevis f. inornata TaxID=1714386 RepID=A0A9W7AQW1_9STRA|nr:hypothetical protein TL16_g06887 [Triparma laevis f. inornata]
MFNNNFASHNNISFIGVARISDKAVVASLAYNSTVDLAGVKNVLNEKIGMQAGTHYSFSIGQTTWHLMADGLGRVFIAITASSYPARVATQCVDDLSRTFVAKAGEKSLTCKEKALDKACKSLFEKICAKYDNLSEVDVLSGVTAKVESVKLVMQENVELALQNCVTLESIEEKAEQLQQQAGVFKKTAKDIRNKMWWKNLKMKLAIAFIILAILGVILAVTIPKVKAATGSDDNDGD